MVGRPTARYYNHIDARDEFGDPINFFNVTWLYFDIDIFRQFFRPSLDFRRLPHITCVCQNNHLKAVFEAAFGFWQPPIWKDIKVPPNTGLLAKE